MITSEIRRDKEVHLVFKNGAEMRYHCAAADIGVTPTGKVMRVNLVTTQDVVIWINPEELISLCMKDLVKMHPAQNVPESERPR